MITAEEFLIENKVIGMTHLLTDIMIEFAKLHCEKQAKIISENIKMKLRNDVHELDMNDDWMEVDKDSILNAYPLDLIK